MGSPKTFSGRIWNGQQFEDGRLVIEGGTIKDIEFGSLLEDADYKGVLIPGIVDTHTHVADSGLILDRKYGLEELVAPPDGLKHRYLRDTDAERIKESMGAYISKLEGSGVSRFIDFREGGAEGAKLLRSVSDRAVILGRPVSKEYDPNEIDDILRYADGIGIPSITDMDAAYVDAVADHIHRRNKMLALHVSERIREDIDKVISLEPDFVVHMVQATDGDMRRCADSGIPISVCPTSNMYFGMVPPVGRMIDAGAEVSLGTDNGMLFPSADIYDEIRTLSGLLAAQGKGPHAAFDVAFARGHNILYDETLTLDKTGMRADFTIFPCDEYELIAGSMAPSARYGP